MTPALLYARKLAERLQNLVGKGELMKTKPLFHITLKKYVRMLTTDPFLLIK
jgi:hypothetical protein